MRRDREVTCDAAAAVLPSLADDGDVPGDIAAHVETCLRCHADLAHYRRLRRDLRLLRGDRLLPPTDALPAALAALRAQPADGRRPVVLGGVVATAAGAAAGVAGMLVWRSRRRTLVG